MVGAAFLPAGGGSDHDVGLSPLSDEKIVTGLHAPVTSSLRWLATLAEYLLKMMHVQLKVVSGRVIRVFRR